MVSKTRCLFTHSLCYTYFSQFIHHILFNVSANQNLYQERFNSGNILIINTIIINYYYYQYQLVAQVCMYYYYLD